MKRYYFVVILMTFSIFAASIKDNTEAKIKNKYPANEVVFEKYKIPQSIKTEIEYSAKQKFFRPELYLWRIQDGSKLISIILLDNVLGKSMPITFIVEFDISGKIIASEIVKYREDHGGEVANEKWQRQFINKSGADQFIVGRDVDGITGATISSNSVAKGIKKLALLAKRILKNEN